MVDPATLPDIIAPPSKRSAKKKNEEEQEEDERKIDLSEIIGLPDFDVCPLVLHSLRLKIGPLRCSIIIIGYKPAMSDREETC